MESLAGVHDVLRGGLDPRPLSRPELYDRISDLERVRCRIDERLMAAKATLDSLGDAGADSSAVGRSVGRRTERQLKKDMVTAQGLAEIPPLAESLAEDRLNVEHAAVVADAAERVTPEVAQELVKTAEAMPADRFAQKAREFIAQHTSAQQAEARHRKQRGNRAGWHKTHGDGSVEIHARSDKATGEEVLAAWRRRSDRMWRDDGGRDGSPADIRTHGQRRADALAELIIEETPAGAEPVHPRLQVRLVWNLNTGDATWLDGTLVPDSVLLEMGPTADVIGHVFSGDGQPLWQGRSKRLATEAQWRSLIVATRGCAECGADIDRCHAHHLREWLNDQGPSHIDNLQLLCHTCHGHAHRGSRGDPKRHRRGQPYRANPPPRDRRLSADALRRFEEGRTCGGATRR